MIVGESCVGLLKALLSTLWMIVDTFGWWLKCTCSILDQCQSSLKKGSQRYPLRESYCQCVHCFVQQLDPQVFWQREDYNSYFCASHCNCLGLACFLWRKVVCSAVANRCFNPSQCQSCHFWGLIRTVLKLCGWCP